jgi:hypothetical protein
VLARYRVESLPMLTVMPDIQTPLNAEFIGLGELLGFSLNDPPFSLQSPPAVTFVWQAGDSSPLLDYTVSVQLIDEAGQVIAQSDAVPGGRPTTGWRAGEYIVDAHTLSFNDVAGQGMARLIVAVYDPQTGGRLGVAGAGDAAVLAAGLEVETGTP